MATTELNNALDFNDFMFVGVTGDEPLPTFDDLDESTESSLVVGVKGLGDLVTQSAGVELATNPDY